MWRNFKYILRYISSAKHIKLFFIIKVNTFWGERRDFHACDIGGEKNDGDFNANLHKNPLQRRRRGRGDGEGIRYTTTTKNTIHMNGGE